MAVNSAKSRKVAKRKHKPAVSIVGAGSLAGVLAVSLRQAGYVIDSVVARSARASMRRAQNLANKVSSRAMPIQRAQFKAEVVWLCVPDAAISRVARLLEAKADWRGKIALHSSGTLTSDELSSLRRRGAAVASVHPLMTFVKGVTAPLNNVPFAIEGDASAVRCARQIVRDLGGLAFSIRKRDKVAYHAWGMFASPLLTALLAASERMAAIAGVPAKAAQRRMLPITAQTIAHYIALGPAGAFSGPILRGDVEVVKRHLQILRDVPELAEVYRALARAATRYLPGKNRRAMKDALKNS